MRIRAATVIGSVIGCGLAFWLFGLAFTRSTTVFYAQATFPLLLSAIASGVLVRLFQESLSQVVVALAAPTTLWCAYAFVAVLREGRGAEWAYAVTAGLVATTALLGAIAGRRLAQRTRAR